MSALAVLPARNEAGYIAVTLQALIDEGCEVVLIDHGSVDGTREVAERFLGAGLLRIQDHPWKGEFDLGELLANVEGVFEQSSHAWHLFVGADEWLRADCDLPLADFLRSEVSRDFEVVNFREYAFLPPLGVDMWGQDFRQLATSYYLFEPGPRRLMRAWRRGARVGSLVESAGHTFADVASNAVYPMDQVLRHYIGLSWSHAIGKRANRHYAARDLARGWHGNRLNLRAASPVAVSPYFRTISPWDSRNLDASMPSPFHFWDPGFRTADRPDGA
jgi:hypothetical protein